MDTCVCGQGTLDVPDFSEAALQSSATLSDSRPITLTMVVCVRSAAICMASPLHTRHVWEGSDMLGR